MCADMPAYALWESSGHPIHPREPIDYLLIKHRDAIAHRGGQRGLTQAHICRDARARWLHSLNEVR